MKRPGPVRRRWSLLLLGFALMGCQEEWGPESIPLTEVQGSITVSGKPLSHGWVELQPLDNTLGAPTSARIHANGRFHFPTAPVGEVAVRLINIPVDLPGASWIFRNSSPIRRVTQSPVSPPMTIDVMEELIRYRSSAEAAR